MSISKITLLAAGLALGLWSTTAVVHTAHAQGAQNTPGNMLDDVGENEVLTIGPSGKMVRHKRKMVPGQGKFKKMQSMGAREIKGAMIVKRGGKLYLLEDKPGKTPAKSMIQENFQDDFNLNQY